MFKPRDYQIELSEKGCEILKKYRIVYFALQVRVGKTFTSLMTAEKYGSKNVLFLTKKKAISSIQYDYDLMKPSFDITIINDESMHKIEGDFDLVIHDEHHRFGSLPKPGKYTKMFKESYGHLPMIFLSGTPHPENYAQIYNQFWVKNGFWKNHTNFYKWFKVYGKPQKRHLGYAEVNIYTELNEKGVKLIDKMKQMLFVSFTQRDAGFETSVNKNIIYCEPEQQLIDYSKELAKNKFITIDGHDIEADTAVKLQNKIHQISNGSIITETGETLVLSDFKAKYIQNYFKGKKLAIFYYYKAERQILKKVFGDTLTNDLEEFNSTDKHIALQQSSGSEGISLKKADVLVYYNFGFSNVKFVQGIDRLTTMDRKENNVYFVFSKGSINEQIYNTIVYHKKDYILSAFKQDFDIPTNYNKL